MSYNEIVSAINFERKRGEERDLFVHSLRAGNAVEEDMSCSWKLSVLRVGPLIKDTCHHFHLGWSPPCRVMVDLGVVHPHQTYWDHLADHHPEDLQVAVSSLYLFSVQSDQLASSVID